VEKYAGLSKKAIQEYLRRLAVRPDEASTDGRTLWLEDGSQGLIKLEEAFKKGGSKLEFSFSGGLNFPPGGRLESNSRGFEKDWVKFMAGYGATQKAIQGEPKLKSISFTPDLEGLVRKMGNQVNLDYRGEYWVARDTEGKLGVKVWVKAGDEYQIVSQPSKAKPTPSFVNLLRGHELRIVASPEFDKFMGVTPEMVKRRGEG